MSLLNSAAQYSGAGAPTAQAGQIFDQYHDRNVAGSLYICVTAGNPGTWQQVAGGDDAPGNAHYLIQTANSSLTNAQVMGSLATGIVKNTTTTGVQSIANGNIGPAGDYYATSYQYFYNDNNLNMFLTIGGATTPSVIGLWNILIGTVPRGLTTGEFNTCVGINNFNALVNGQRNTIIGSGAANLMSLAASYNTIGGMNALSSVTNYNGNTAWGYAAGANYDGLVNCSFFGNSAQTTTANLSNASAYGAGALISVNNGVNFGGTTGVFFGINNETPQYCLDIGPQAFNGDNSIALQTMSAPPATSGTKGRLWAGTSLTSTLLNFTDINNSNIVLNKGGFQYIIIANSDITLSNDSSQNLRVGIQLTGHSLIFPNFTEINPLAAGMPYNVTTVSWDGTNTYSPITPKDYLGNQITDLANNAIVMQPGTNWTFVYLSAAGKVYGISTGSNGQANGCLQGQFYSYANTAVIPSNQSYFSWETVNNTHVKYTLPGWSGTMTGASDAIGFRTTGNALFPVWAIPAAATWIVPGGASNGSTVQIYVVINPSNATSQITWYSSTASAPFVNSFLIPPTTLCVPI